MKLFAKGVVAAVFAFLFVGCFSTPQPLNVSTVYPFEGRYGSDVEISIAGERAEVKDGDSVWILSNHTVYNLLTSVSDHPDKVVFGNRAYSIKDGSIRDAGLRDTFDDEEYVWESWTIPDSGGK